MIKAGEDLQVFYPNIFYLPQVHALNRLVELVHTEYPTVNNLNNSGQKVFLNAPLRAKNYKVRPCFIKIILIILHKSWRNLVASLCQSSKGLVSNTEQYLAFIKANFSMLVTVITNFGIKQLPLGDSFKI
nr:unnamed protein product [Callosobruchus analis]